MQVSLIQQENWCICYTVLKQMVVFLLKAHLCVFYENLTTEKWYIYRYIDRDILETIASFENLLLLLTITKIQTNFNELFKSVEI